MKKQGTYNKNGDKWCHYHRRYESIVSFGKSSKSKDGKDWQCLLSKRIVTSNYRSKVKVEECKIIMIQPIDEAPILSSQMLYKYQRPDAYDIYINNINSNR